MTEKNEILKKLYNACDPYRPATESQYLDMSASRGGGSFVQEFRRRLELADDFLSTLFAGHIGSGKSSELGALVRNLKSQEPRFFPIRINASDFLDDYDVDTPDILLAIVTEVAATLRRDLKIELKDSYFAARLVELRDVLLSDVEINEGEIPLWEASIKVQRIKKDPTARQKVREVLKPRLSTILEEMNTLFVKIREELRKHGETHPEERYGDIVCLVDNLEKIRQVNGRKEGLESQRELFLERYAQFVGLQAHFVWTVPLRLLRSVDGPQLAQRYDGDPYVLPMVKVRTRTGQAYPSGVDELRKVLQGRITAVAPGTAVTDIVTEDALEFLLRYSGGHVRNLMMFLQTSCSYTQLVPIALEAVQRAIQQPVRTYSTSIPESHWQKLALLDQSPDQMIPGGDLEYLSMLENLSVLEYVNGDGGDIFAAAEPWYAVNPIVRELKKFKEAIARLPRS